VASTEDAPELLAALRREGLPVQRATTAGEALRLARQHPSLVLLGGRLPDLDPGEVCRRLKGDPDTAAVPVLHLGEPLDGEDGADGYLRPPVHPRDLVAWVRGLLRLRRAEDALRASESRLQDILDHAPVVVYVKDTEGRYLLVNRHWEECFRLGRAAVLGRSAHEIHPPTRARTLLANDRRVLEAGAPLEFEEELPLPGGPRTFLSVKFPLRGVEGACAGVCGISTDITDRKGWEKALDDSAALYHSLVETLPVSILRKDTAGRFTFANRAFCAALGHPAAEVVGRMDQDFYPPELAQKYVADDRRVMETGEVFEAVEKNQAADGSPTWVEVVKSPLRDSRGSVIGVQAVFWDVTERKRAEAELGRNAAEFAVARRIQQKLFPAAPPRLPGMEIGAATFGFDIGGASYPAEAIGGDYFDYIPLADGALGLAVGDVSGHGLGPALLMAEVRAYLRAFAQTQTDGPSILGLVNRIIAQDMEGDRFITLLLARLDPGARTLTYASAGHHTGYVFDAEGAVKRVLRSTGIPLGILPQAEFAGSEPIPLGPGDLVLLLTDGVVEARAPDGSAFGGQRVIDLMRVYRRSSAREIADNLYHAVRAFAQYQPQVDDITVAVVKVGCSESQ
jgi:sigma-B regulation protein RsbU (phosphoserine phosphatase)